MNKLILFPLYVAAALTATSAEALTINPVNGAGAGTALLNAVLAPSSGINVVGGTLNFTGKTDAGKEQSATYTGFTLTPSSGSGATITNPDGILLTSGNANLPTTNTVNNFSNNLVQPGTGSNTLLSTLSGKITHDQNFISFDFTLADPSQNAVSANFVFASDEFPFEPVTDIFGFFVDNVNYAFFPGGALVSNILQANFQKNPTPTLIDPAPSPYPIEYNGLTTSLFVQGILKTNLTIHTLTIAIADTDDSIFDSGVFIGGLKGGTGNGGGIIDPPTVPEPSALAIMGLGLAGFALGRRKSA